MSKKLEMGTTLVEYSDFIGIDFIDPATYYIRMASGDYLYIHTKERKLAQDYVDKEFGKNHFKIRASKNIVKTPHYDGHSITARG